MSSSKHKQLHDDLQMRNFVQSILKTIPGGLPPNQQTEKREQQMQTLEVSLKAKAAVASAKDK